MKRDGLASPKPGQGAPSGLPIRRVPGQGALSSRGLRARDYIPGEITANLFNGRRAIVRDMSTYDVVMSPARRKLGSEAWKPRTDTFTCSGDAKEAIRAATIMLQPHIFDLQDDDLIEVTRDDGAMLFPERTTVARFRLSE